MTAFSRTALSFNPQGPFLGEPVSGRSSPRMPWLCRFNIAGWGAERGISPVPDAPNGTELPGCLHVEELDVVRISLM
jgi:hypothetical protein